MINILLPAGISAYGENRICELEFLFKYALRGNICGCNLYLGNGGCLLNQSQHKGLEANKNKTQ